MNTALFFLVRIQEKRQDQDIEGLFTVLQNTIELRDSSLERCHLASESHLPSLRANLEQTLADCQAIYDSEFENQLETKLNENRDQRRRQWQQFVDDMTHKCSRVDNTFEEKKEELREFYSDLEQKLHIHK